MASRWPRDNEAALIGFYGDPAHGIEAQLVHVAPPFRMIYEGKTVDHLVFHKKAADALFAALTQVWDYYGHDQAKLDALGISKTAGTFNLRKIAGSNRWSNHAFGAAIDINADDNGFNKGHGNIPLPMIAAFKAQGARWGGDYHGRTDPMHFEFCESGEPEQSFEAWLAHYGVTKAPATPVPATPAVAPPAAPAPAQDPIVAIANASPIMHYPWRGRGAAPVGYTRGMALTFAQAYRRLKSGDPAVLEMAKANTHNDEHDALAWYNSNFAAVGMSNDHPGADTLRHLFVLMLGHGMRESSGQHCCGRDHSAANVASDTAEAGLFQTSYNAHTCHPTFDPLMDTFKAGKLDGFLPTFQTGITCSAADWSNYGSGRGADFQEICKKQPAFSVESAAIVLRNLRRHYGPINRKEVELRPDADAMFKAVQAHIDAEVTA